MKKNRLISFITLIALLLVCFSACSPDDNTVEAPYEPVFLIEATLSMPSDINSQFEKPEAYGVSSVPMFEVLPELEGSTVKSPVSGQELKYSLSESYYKNRETKELGTHYTAYHKYESGSESVTVLHGTDFICLYSNVGGEYYEELAVTPTTANAESLATAFLKKMVGSDAVSGLECTAVSSGSDAGGSFDYVVSYMRVVNGLKTDELVTVYFYNDCIAGFNAKKLGKFDGLEEKISDRKIERATDALTDKITSLNLMDAEIDEPILTTNLDGELFLRFHISYKDEEGSVCTENIFVNVN